MVEKEAIGTQRLLIDLGATNARFALQAEGALPECIWRVSVREQPGLLAAVRSYLAGTGAQPRAAALAVASPITGDWIALTNHTWSFSVAEIRAALKFEHLSVINDFTAIALALPRLARDDLIKVGGEAAQPDAPLAVLGPGTGLGVSGLLPTPAGWYAISGEGGHVTLPASDEREEAVLRILRGRFDHVSAERVLSGQGLVNLYTALAELEGMPAGDLTPAEINEQGTIGVDPIAREALDLFCAMLGTVAGDLTLTLGARGGCFVAGGIVPKLRDFFLGSRFRDRFEDKGRFREYLTPIPAWLVTYPTPAFLGLAHLLDQKLGGISS